MPPVALKNLIDKVRMARVLNNFGILMHDRAITRQHELHESLLLVEELGTRAGI